MTKLISEEQITENISKYLLETNVDASKPLIDIYNDWSLSQKIIIENSELVEFAVKTLHDMLGIDSRLLKEAINILK